VLRSDDGGVARLTLNRPEKLNALTPEVFAALHAHLEAVAADDSVACVVLAGAGRSFCAGHDFASMESGGLESSVRDAETIDLLEALPQPTVARIHGHCFTGGLELALACDLLVVARSAQLGDTHGQWGLVPLWGMSVRLPERVGRGRAKELMFTSRRITGDEAAAIGLADRCVADDDLDAAVAALTAEIVANARGTNRVVKALLRANASLTRDDALRFERTMPFGFPAGEMAERMARRGP